MNLNKNCWLYYAKCSLQSAESKWKVVCLDQNCFCSCLIYSKLVRKTWKSIPNKIHFLCRHHSTSNSWMRLISLQICSTSNEKLPKCRIFLWTVFRHARVSSTYPSKMSVGWLVGWLVTLSDFQSVSVSGRPTWKVEERGPQLFFNFGSG